jgi:RHS repeat-associated protein
MTSGPLPVSPTTNSTLLWDGENRLAEVKNSAGTTLEQNFFDAGSRKIATTANGITTLYLYDGWNCIAEYTRSVGVSATLQKTRLWGTDLSGSMQGAGGVGGILSESSPITSNPITFNSSYPTYDGNGNVSEYLNSTGQVTAHFEYDPFGNTVVNTDTSNLFTYRFSTKPISIATGLYYYGYRYYDPMTGRWPSRDPIEENGGVNLYVFVRNNSVNLVDKLGLASCCPVGQGPPQEYDPEFECCINGSKKNKLMLYQRDYGGNLEKCIKDSTLGSIAKHLQNGLGTAAGAAMGLIPGAAGYVAASRATIIGAGSAGVGNSLIGDIAQETGNNVATARCQRLVCPKK